MEREPRLRRAPWIGSGIASRSPNRAPSAGHPNRAPSAGRHQGAPCSSGQTGRPRAAAERRGEVRPSSRVGERDRDQRPHRGRRKGCPAHLPITGSVRRRRLRAICRAGRKSQGSCPPFCPCHGAARAGPLPSGPLEGGREGAAGLSPVDLADRSESRDSRLLPGAGKAGAGARALCRGR